METSLVRKRGYTIRKYKQGWSGNDIARELQEPRSTIYEWIKKYNNCSKDGLQINEMFINFVDFLLL